MNEKDYIVNQTAEMKLKTKAHILYGLITIMFVIPAIPLVLCALMPVKVAREWAVRTANRLSEWRYQKVRWYIQGQRDGFTLTSK
jgi:hypothetical protein